MTKKFGAWVVGLTVTVGALIMLWNQFGVIRAGIAQDAAEAGAVAAEIVVEEMMMPVQMELVDIRFAQEREFIENKWDQCMTYEYLGEGLDVRRMCCDYDRDWRWAVYNWDKCVEREGKDAEAVCKDVPLPEECP